MNEQSVIQVDESYGNSEVRLRFRMGSLYTFVGNQKSKCSFQSPPSHVALQQLWSYLQPKLLKLNSGM